MAQPMEAINTIRCLAADIVQKAKSGHPGMPIGMAPVAHVLWSEFLNFDPQDPDWYNRDRFVLSNGHGSALLYSMLHLTGYDLGMEDLKQFRQLHSKTPGHPERGETAGVEVTTGPLGQGIANGVGMAMAQAHLAARFNKDDVKICDHFVYIFCGDGCLMEGPALEAISLAGHLGLGNIILIYDDNKITIDGSTDLSFTEDVPAKMRACKWHAPEPINGDMEGDLDSIRKAIEEAKAVTDRPTIISLRTTIGMHTHVAGTSKAHGAPLGPDGVTKLKQAVSQIEGEEKHFHVDQSVYDLYKKSAERGQQAKAAWRERLAEYEKKYPAEYGLYQTFLENKQPENVAEALPKFEAGTKMATRKASQAVLNALIPQMPNLMGGSADLTPSTLTAWTQDAPNQCADFQAGNYGGRYIRFGVREHGMTGIGNGMAAYGGFRPFVSTFFNFVGYAMGAVRVGAMSKLPLLFIGTHDSIGVGEDGPTHQPIEISASLRATPNLYLIRPADAAEVAGAYTVAVGMRESPVYLALTRQDCVVQEGSRADGVAKGAYIIHGSAEGAQLVVLASGSEVGPCVDAAKLISDKKVVVVSFPCWKLFDQQPQEYKDSVLLKGVPRVSVEAWTTVGWSRYAEHNIGIDQFGVSAPAPKAFEHFNLHPEGLAKSFSALIA